MAITMRYGAEKTYSFPNTIGLRPTPVELRGSISKPRNAVLNGPWTVTVCTYQLRASS
jgi:hypothetical protein